MNIALLSEKYTPDIGGLAISTERLARLLTSAGGKVRLFCPSPNLLASEKRTLTHNGVSVTRFGAHKRVDDTLLDWFELIVAEHKGEPFDVLHAYFLTQAGFVATYAGIYLNVPSVVSIRGNDIERAAFDPSRFSHTMYALQNANAVTTNASELAKKAKVFIEREIVLIPNGVDTEHFKPMEKNAVLAEALGLNSLESGGLPPSFREQAPEVQIPVIGFVGELREKKGLKTLLSASAMIHKKRPVALLIVGEVRQGEDRQVFDEFQTSHPDSKIIVTGYIPPKDLPAYYSLTDVFVHPSLRDGMPNAVLEAMACEKAVIATPVGGVLDVVKDGENGSTVPANDAESLSNAIIKLLDDEPLRGRLGKSARETIQKEFTLQKELDANLRVYEQLGLQP
jgi:L-malate glycosyltransferase